MSASIACNRYFCPFAFLLHNYNRCSLINDMLKKGAKLTLSKSDFCSSISLRMLSVKTACATRNGACSMSSSRSASARRFLMTSILVNVCSLFFFYNTSAVNKQGERKNACYTCTRLVNWSHRSASGLSRSSVCIMPLI